MRNGDVCISSRKIKANQPLTFQLHCLPRHVSTKLNIFLALSNNIHTSDTLHKLPLLFIFLSLNFPLLLFSLSFLCLSFIFNFYYCIISIYPLVETDFSFFLSFCFPIFLSFFFRSLYLPTSFSLVHLFFLSLFLNISRLTFLFSSFFRS